MFPCLEKQASNYIVKWCSPVLSYCCQAPTGRVHCLFSGTDFYTPLQVQEQDLLSPGKQASGFEATVGGGRGGGVCWSHVIRMHCFNENIQLNPQTVIFGA